jgi:Putative ER transporter, 6TM, N-terminal
MFFVCSAWTVSAIAQAISWRLRGYPTQEDAYQQLLNDGYDCGTLSPTQCLQSAIFQGYFLEIGPTVVNAVFFTVAMSIALWIKMKRKQFIFSVVFMTITLVICMSYGPLYPYFDGTLGVQNPYSMLTLVTHRHSKYTLNEPF